MWVENEKLLRETCKIRYNTSYMKMVKNGSIKSV